MVEYSCVRRYLLFTTRSDFSPCTVKIYPLLRQSTMIVCNSNVEQTKSVENRRTFQIVEIAIPREW